MGSTNSETAGDDNKPKPLPLSTNPEVIAEKLTSPSNTERSSRDDRALSPPASSATSAHFNLPKSEASTPGVEKPSYDLPLLTKQSLKVGLVGAGIGGLTAAIAIARAGCDVTVLEAAAELGEIGAGIQITPNVSRLLIRYGVDKIIGDNLVQSNNINMRNRDGVVVQRTELYPKTVREFGFPWWSVHRHHLINGLAEAARRHGVEIVTNARVANIVYKTSPVEVETEEGKDYTFDLLIGSDGLNSVVRNTLFPKVFPRTVTNVAAYRAVLPYEEVYRNVPESRDFGNDIDVFTMEKGYVIMYPIAAGREWNAVMAHVTDKPVTDVEEDCSMEEVREYYKDMDERVTKILELVPSTKRWPLMTVGPLKSWSSPQKNVAIMGDAAHAMVNHLAQGAATSMEDGAFLGRVLREVITGVLTLPEAVKIYEDTRMPRAWAKQQESFINGSIFMAEDEPRGRLRDEAAADSVAETKAMSEVWNLDSKAAVTGPDENALCPNLWGAPETLQSVFSYDPEGDADFAVIKHIQDTTPWDKVTGVSEGLEEKWTGWFWPKDQIGRVAKARGTDL